MWMGLGCERFRVEENDDDDEEDHNKATTRAVVVFCVTKPHIITIGTIQH